MSAIITVITGVPGSGKSALALDLILKHYKGRPLYVDNFDGLTIDHYPFDLMDWHNEVPDGAVILADEVQRKWRPRGPGSKVPEAISMLETHRHRGIDIVVITQNVRLIDANVRALAGKHLHIRNTGWMGRWLYEFPECDPANSWKRCDNKRRYTLPKHVFSLYKSASMHMDPVRTRPILLYFLCAAVFALLYLLWTLYGNFNAEPAAQPTQVLQQTTGIGSSIVASTGLLPESSSSSIKLIDDRVDWIPRISSMPETAPAFDAIRKVQQFPVVSGGVCFQGECKCFTQQGTNAGLSHDECLTAINNPRFDAYSDPQAAKAQQAPTVSANKATEDDSPEITHAVVKRAHDDKQAVSAAAKTQKLVLTGAL